MVTNPRPSRRVWGVVSCVVLVASMSGFATATAKTVAPAALAKAPAERVTSGSRDIVATKLDARLGAMATSARSSAAKATSADVAVLVAKGTSSPKGLEQAIRLKLRADTSKDLWVGRVRVSNLVKLASQTQVFQVFENGRREAPPVPEDSRAPKTTRRSVAQDAKKRLAVARDTGVLDAFASSFDGGAPEKIPGLDSGSATGWFDVSSIGHDSVGAWSQGYDGTGVRVAVADDSVDFAHPDLMGTQAVVTNPASPYYGWPEAFDPYSVLLYAYDALYGTTNVQNGNTWFTDSSATITGGSAVFDGQSDWEVTGTSLSGIYHIGYLWDENLDQGWWGYPAVLVVDEHKAGVYDTVYVDLDMGHSFKDDKPCTKSDPVSYLDFWDSAAGVVGSDGYADLSGGMVYWISDGTNQPPGYDFMVGGSADAPPSGCMVSFMGALNVGEGHGTLCASNMVGQGVTDGASDAFVGDASYPSFKVPTGGGGGIVQGAARDADLVAIGDIYWNHFTSTLMAYDYAAYGLDETAGTADDIQCVSNSYGESDDDADEWDYRSRYVTQLNLTANPKVSFLFSTGNGGPGYGTNAPPTAATGIGVGASTQMGACGGWDSILDASQVNVGDVIPWSNRGPSAAGHLGPAVVADGAYSSGAVALNQGAGDGWRSWEVWGGTSRSCPVAAGNLALVFEAYRDANSVWPDWSTARDLLMSGATDLNYDTLSQGAGMVDASKSVSLAAGNGGLSISPAVWYPGSYRGDHPTSYASLLSPGERADGTLLVSNTGSSTANVTVSDSWLQLDSVETTTITLVGSSESSYDFNRPDVLRDITAIVRDANADLMVIRADEPFAEFAPTGEFNTVSTTHNVPRLLVYNWKDQDSDGRLWTDTNSNGFVNVGEIDSGEYMRFTYANNFADSQEVRVQRPQDRGIDGVFLGLQHNKQATTSPNVTVQVRIEFWSRVDQPWLSEGTTSTALGAGVSMRLPVSVSVPFDAPVGIYEGEYRVSDGSNTTVVPVHMNVAGSGTNFRFGDVAGAPTTLMPNGRMFGYQDWNWRAESGDWRFFATDVEDPLPDGAVWLVHTDWPDTGAPTSVQADNDTLLFGMAADAFSEEYPSDFGPGTLTLSGGSANANILQGIWLPETSTGATSEWVAAPLGNGLNQIMIHNVVWPGTVSELPFTGEAGIASVDPARVDIVDSEGQGNEPIAFSTSLALNGVSAHAYGFSRRYDGSFSLAQGDSWTHQVTLTGAAYLEAKTSGTSSDIDLYVYDSSNQLVGASKSSSGDEYVKIDLPADDTYEVEVYGYSILGGTDGFDVSISSPMGDDLTLRNVPSGAVTAGDRFTFDMDWSKDWSGSLAEREGTFEGLVTIGPSEAPSAVRVPVSLRYPFEVESMSPAKSAVVDDPDPSILVRLSKRVDAATLSGSSLYVSDGATALGGETSYDPDTATVELTLDDPLLPGRVYTVVVEGLASIDGDTLSTEWSFTTNDPVLRTAGTDRYRTSAQISQENWDSSDVVIVATGERFPDALAASGLAGCYDAPLLLTASKSLPIAIRDEIARLGATKVIIVGGEAAVSSTVASSIAAIRSMEVSRVAGGDRYDTAAIVARRIASEAGGAPVAYVASGADFPDALACSAYSFARRVPVLLTKRDTLPTSTKSALTSLGITNVVLAGGPRAVSTAVQTAIDAIPHVGVQRLEGEDRYLTAGAIAEDAVSRGWATWGYLGIASGRNFPDTLSGAAACGRHGGVVLMTDPVALSGATRAKVVLHADVISHAEVFGGVQAVAAGIVTELRSLLW